MFPFLLIASYLCWDLTNCCNSHYNSAVCVQIHKSMSQVAPTTHTRDIYEYWTCVQGYLKDT